MPKSTVASTGSRHCLATIKYGQLELERLEGDQLGFKQFQVRTDVLPRRLSTYTNDWVLTAPMPDRSVVPCQ